MKDFDFDELDRAVNSVLAKKDTPESQQTDSSNVPVSTDTGASVPVQTNDTDNNDTVAVTTDDNENGEAVAVAVSTDSTTADDSPREQDNEESTSEDYHASQQEDESSADEQSEAHVEKTETESVDETQPIEQNTQDDAETASISTGDYQGDADTETDEEESPSESVVSKDTTTSLASIPVKRGRFMDVMTPQNGETKKPMGPRGGVTLTPSSDFSPTISPDVSPSDTTPQLDSGVDSTPDVDHLEESPVIKEDTSSIDPQSQEVSKPFDNIETETESTSDQTGATPFIPDVPVTKRPLNPLSSDLQNPAETPAAYTPPESTDPVSDQVSLDPTLTATVPKEFDKDIMAVESNETVGESDETHSETSDTTQGTAEPAQTTDANNSVAMAATTAEPHPMFDTSTLGHDGVATHHSPKLTWIVVAGSLFIVGAALGVLYFLYGQA